MSDRTEQGRALAEIDAVWRDIANGYDIEPRAYFEREAPKNGFRYPLAQAFHHIWKREPKVQPLLDRIAALEKALRDVLPYARAAIDDEQFDPTALAFDLTGAERLLTPQPVKEDA